MAPSPSVPGGVLVEISVNLLSGLSQVSLSNRIVAFHIFSDLCPAIFIAVAVSTPARLRIGRGTVAQVVELEVLYTSIFQCRFKRSCDPAQRSSFVQEHSVRLKPSYFV